MVRNIHRLFIAIASICLVTCYKTTEKTNTMTSTETAMVDSKSKMDNTKSIMDNTKTNIEFKSAMDDDDDNDDVDLMAVMTMCNETFRIEMSFLTSLNESGSFPDETDKTPKCYLRCVLENLKIASLDDGKLDPERAAVVFAGERNGVAMDDIQEMATYCAQRDEKDHCEMAYNFLKCLFSMEIEKYSKPKSSAHT